MVNAISDLSGHPEEEGTQVKIRIVLPDSINVSSIICSFSDT